MKKAAGSAVALWLLTCAVSVTAAPAAPAKAPTDEASQVTRAVEAALKRHAADAHRCLEKAVADERRSDGGAIQVVAMAARATCGVDRLALACLVLSVNSGPNRHSS